MDVARKEGAAIAYTAKGCFLDCGLGCHLGQGLLGRLFGHLGLLLARLALANQLQDIRLNGFIQLIQRNTGGQHDLDKPLIDQRLIGFIRQMEILGLALDTCDLLLLHHGGNHLQRLVHRALALNLNKHGGIGHFIGHVADKMLVFILRGIERQIHVKRFALYVDARQEGAPLLKGFALPAGARYHLFVGKQLVFDGSIVILQVGGLDKARQVGALVANFDGPTLGSGQGGSGTALLLLQLFTALTLDTACLFFGTSYLLGQHVISLQRYNDGLTNTQLILRELLFVVHQARYGYGFTVLGIVNKVILQLLVIDLGGKVGIGFKQTLLRKHFYILATLHDTGIKLGILQRNGGVKIGNVIIGRLFCKLVTNKRVANLIKAFNKLP